jgi:hypothetical protein
MPLLQAFPFPCTLGEVTLHLLSQACVFIYSSPGKWIFLLLLWSFPPTATFISFPTLACWACAAAVPAFSSLACLCTAHVGSGSSPPFLWSFPPSAPFTSFPVPDCWACAAIPAFSSPACLFTVLWVIPSPTLWFSVHPTLFATCLYCSYCLLLSFFFFPGWELVCPGGYADLAQGCLWEYCVPLSSPCGPHLPKPSGCAWLVVAWGPSWFLLLMWSGDAMRRLEVWRSQSFASSRWFCLQGVSPVSLQDFTLGGMLSASSL